MHMLELGSSARGLRERALWGDVRISELKQLGLSAVPGPETLAQSKSASQTSFYIAGFQLERGFKGPRLRPDHTCESRFIRDPEAAVHPFDVPLDGFSGGMLGAPIQNGRVQATAAV
ncbi:hypothetical protein SKAU_G00002570 [Synaphobranchus kaupii]|uniref:Uncharacterized protein n=1 Tax=Synaphobranchus kaupii TaxID=118154 RepID=A0A9Q1G9M0_SYNKA|nr:hypothetical protein SKAU_G00002570 [Synaphobranchus kaupii]